MDTAGRIRLGGLVAGLSVAVALTPGSLRGIAAPVFVVSLVLTVLVGEVVLPRPERGRRSSAAGWSEPASPGLASERSTAMLEVRRIRDFAPRGALRGVVALVIVFVVLAGFAAALAVSVAGTFEVVGGWGLLGLAPSFAAVLAFGILVAWVTLRQVARAPRAGGDEDRHGDEAWRRRTATSIIVAAGVLASLAVVGMVAAITSMAGGAVAVLSPVTVLAVLSLGWYSILFIRPAAPPVAGVPASPMTGAAGPEPAPVER